MIKFLKELFLDQEGGLGITRLSIVSAVATDTGDESDDAVVKIRQLVNRCGSQFCKITDFPFLRSDTTISITTSDYKYSGSSYLPTTFKEVIAAYILSNNTRHPLEEDGIIESYGWPDPTTNDGLPDRFCITRMEDGYWEIAFNKTPDQTYTVYIEMKLHWSDLTADTSETLITDDYFGAFAHYCTMHRLKQQGDLETYAAYKSEWWNAADPKGSILGQILADLSSGSKRKQVIVREAYILPFVESSDYQGISSYEDFVNAK